jgi:alkylation response protein AidB-like acyl-CoA dehydrogenase
MSRPWPARRRAEGDSYVLDGEKTWISNGGIADFYVVFARTGEAPGSRGIRPSSLMPIPPASRSPSAST